MEDVLEALLQEQIYDESDKYEREALRLSNWVAQKWKGYTRRKKKERGMESIGEDGGSSGGSSSRRGRTNSFSMRSIVEQAMDANERTGLLEQPPNENSDGRNSGFLTPIQGVKDFFDNLTWPPS